MNGAEALFVFFFLLALVFIGGAILSACGVIS